MKPTINGDEYDISLRHSWISYYDHYDLYVGSGNVEAQVIAWACPEIAASELGKKVVLLDNLM